METAAPKISPRAAPSISLPASANTVLVRAIDTESKLVCNADAFVQPTMAGHELLNFTTMCFLIEHEGESGPEYVLFDCGLRKDFWNTTPYTQRMIGSFVPGMDVRRGVDEILTDQGFDFADLSKSLQLSKRGGRKKKKY